MAVDLKLVEEYVKIKRRIEQDTEKMEGLQKLILQDMDTDVVQTFDAKVTRVVTRTYPLKKSVTVEIVAEKFPDAIIKGKDSIDKKALEANPHARELFEEQPKESVHLRTLMV